jgi:hypothetical protein
MTLRLLLIAFFSLLAGQASADCDWDLAMKDIRFLHLDKGAEQCMYKQMLRNGLNGWDAMKRCNEHANYVNLNACDMPKLCAVLRKEKWTPACAGDPKIRRRR